MSLPEYGVVWCLIFNHQKTPSETQSPVMSRAVRSILNSGSRCL
jgi:hypothetical protein